MHYVVTGGTGFIGTRLVDRILALPDTSAVHVLVRRQSLGRFERLAQRWGDRVRPLVGDLTAPNLGLTDAALDSALDSAG
ncbi:MAG: SDR family oxidoreductase, partial [Actinomycetia bacterium]|nr:SDR family oxidoreductase [Actinomycetes bacterium]